MTSLQRSIECSDVSYQEHWWQIWWPNGKEHLAAREHPYLTIYKLCLRNLVLEGGSSESRLVWQLGWKERLWQKKTSLDLTLACSFDMCWEKDSVPASHTPKYLYEVTTSNSKPSEVVISPVGRGALFLPNHMTFVLEVFRIRFKGRESLLDTKKALL